MNSFTNALGLDIGAARIGVARVNSIARLPEPLCVLKNDESFTTQLDVLVKEHGIDLIVVGRPRNMKGETTHQTEEILKFTHDMNMDVPIVFQDETLSTVKASMYKSKAFAHIEDAVEAAIILEDFVNESNDDTYREINGSV